MSETLEPTAAVLEALHYAAEMHKHHKRKGSAEEPYVNHVIEVVELLARVGGVTDPITLQAAVLHDVVEDTTASFDDVERAFGPAVRGIVAEVTDDKSLMKAERKRIQIDRAPQLSPAAKQIKIADKISNVRAILASPPAEWSHDRRGEYVEWAVRVIDGCRGQNPKLETLFEDTVRECRRALAEEEATR